MTENTQPTQAERDEAQRYYDITVDGLRAQGCKSLRLCGPDTWPRKYQECAYRSPDGLKCAVGLHIPDELYETCWEGMLFVRNPLEHEEEMPVSPGNDFAAMVRLHAAIGNPGHLAVRVLQGLQNVHDNQLISEWEEDFEDISVIYGLKYTRPMVA